MTTAPAQQPQIAPVLGDWQPLPHAGAIPNSPAGVPNPLYDRLIYGKTPSDWAIRIVLVAVMTAALAVGTWSIYTLLTTVFHVPKGIAVLGCGMFDGAALFFALLSQRYATTTDSGFAPRAAMLAMVGISSWVNWQHAQLEQWGTVGGVILASAPAIAELAFLMFHKFAHRETLRSLGRVPQALPTLGKWAWLAHPLRARRTVDAHVKAGLTEHEAIAKRREDLAEVRARFTVSVPITAETELVRVPNLPNPSVHGTPAVPVPTAAEVPTKVPAEVRELAAPAEPAATEPRTSTPQVREPAPAPRKANPRTTEPANLGDRAANKQNQIDQVLNLIDELGYDAVKLGLVMERTGMSKTTAYHRLNDGRAQWHQRNAA